MQFCRRCLHPARARPKLTIFGKTARHEVNLSAGALASSQLTMASGNTNALTIMIGEEAPGKIPENAF